MIREIKDKKGETIARYNYNSNNELEGIQYHYRKGKLIGKSRYENGELEKVESYSEKGNFLKSESYKKDKKHGFQFYYYDDGNLNSLKEKAYYENDEMKEIKMYYKNGNLKYKENLTGIKEYYENGKLKKIVSLENGLLNGISATFLEAGLPIEIKYFEENKLVAMKMINSQYSESEGKMEKKILLGNQEKIKKFEKEIIKELSKNLFREEK